MSKQYVYHFEDAHGLGKELLGGKGAGLAEMTFIGVPIPQGFTITTEACALYYNSGKDLPDYLVKDIYTAVSEVEKKTGKKFGGDKNPLLVSVRSGARVSMPGMMDTILNLGLNDNTVNVLAKETNNERFAYDSYRRFILMFTNIAKGHPRDDMDKMLDDLKKSKGYKLDTEVKADELKELVKKYKEYYKKTFNEEFPTDPYKQLLEAI
ncbi:MAG: pyruvate, phosphate dikinase, partial [Acholeplasmatales bacterium]|nr:pyruvate, phosphate dikinase [Acholeplasmatales bacterium]